MHLFTGPPGSGKTSRLLQQFRESLDRNRDTALLVVPTATLAEHLRNRLAREGRVIRPGTITTFSKFTGGYVEDCPVSTAAHLALALEHELPEIELDAFAPVAGLPGFQSSAVRAMEELSAAGCDAAALGHIGVGDAYATELAHIYEAVERHARGKGWWMRHARLRRAAERIRESGLAPIREVFAAGFYSFTDAETAVLEAISAHAELAIALPRWSGSERCLARLGAHARVTECVPVDSTVDTVLVRPSTPEQEAGEIARRILADHATGRAFREMGVVVRSEQPFVPALRSAFARFGIPARFYFSQRLAQHSVIRYLDALAECAFTGWDHAALIAALRMEGSPLARPGFGDWFEHRVLGNLPGRGLDEFRALASGAYTELFDKLQAIEFWMRGTQTAARWAQRFCALDELYARPRITDGVTETFIAAWRTQAAALDAWRSSMEETAEAIGGNREMSCESFWRAARTVLEHGELRVPDHRRDVVHVMDAFEARQWELPVVYLPNLLEKHFPKYHPQDSIIPEEVRRRLQSAGYEVRTASDRQRDEAFLFETALSRASECVVLSAPAINEKGGDTLVSFFLQKVRAREEAPVPVAPATSWPVARAGRGVSDPVLLEGIQTATARLSVSNVERFLQCPFQFFGDVLLRLKPTPLRPGERLDVRAQGSIIHEALKNMSLGTNMPERLLDEALAAACAEYRIPAGYRTEAVRLELLSNFLRFLSEAPLPPAGSQAEQNCELPMADGTVLRGRIDRIDFTANGAVVVDYKYSGKIQIRKLIEQQRTGQKIQTGVYLQSLRRSGPVAGMLYAGLRNDVEVRGWVEGTYAEITPESEGLTQIIDTALSAADSAIVQIRSGRTEPAPADESKCQYCDYANACRVGIAAPAPASGAGA